jgi:signal peptidase
MRLLRWVPRLLAAALLVVAALSLTGQVRFQPVLTGSMAPHIPTGTLVAVTPVQPAQLRVGEVIMFVPPQPWGTPTGGPILHRIVALTHTPDGRAQIRTKGDANTAMDPWTIDASGGGFSQLRGSSVVAGRLIAMVRHSTSGPALALWPGIVLFGLVLRHTRRTGPTSAGAGHAQVRRYQPRHATGR